MARVDFYLLSEPNHPARWLYACRLCEKAYQKNHQIYILVSSTQESQTLDDLLWTFQADSFLPHEIYKENSSSTSPIHIGILHPEREGDILINLTSTQPPNFKQYKRLIEIIPNIENDRQLARERFRFYRKQAAHPLEVHNC